jgi:hypothetical protein
MQDALLGILKGNSKPGPNLVSPGVRSCRESSGVLERASPNLVEPFTSWRSCICKPIRHGGDEKNNSDRRSLGAPQHATARFGLVRDLTGPPPVRQRPCRSMATITPIMFVVHLFLGRRPVLLYRLQIADYIRCVISPFALQPKMATPPERSESGLGVKAVRGWSRKRTGEIDFQNFLVP